MATIAPFIAPPGDDVRRAAPRAFRHQPRLLRVLRLAALSVWAVAIVLVAALAVRAALALLSPNPAAQPLPPAVTLGREAIVIDPAAAVIATPPDAARSIASPAAGTTGTAELPPIPIADQQPLVGDPGVVAARPFSLARIAAVDRGRALECLTAAIYYEAASEPDDGQRAVAQVVLNRVRHPVFPHTVCGVVYQGSERSGCQFSFACDGSLARIPSRGGWARATRIAAAALGGNVFAPVGLATHYHTYAVTPAWNRTLVMTDAIGAHFFHRWKGFWGTAAAFTQRYGGGEPTPGPHPRELVAAAPASAPPVALPAIAIAGVLGVAAPTTVLPSLQQVQPDHPSSGEPIARNDDSSQILDRWKDSGKPLR